MASRLLEVYLHDRQAGVLRRKDNGNLQFRYDRSYIEAGGQPLSLNLPLRESRRSRSGSPNGPVV